MTYRNVIKFIRTQIKAQAVYQKQYNKAWRYDRKDPQNRPQVRVVPEYPKDIEWEEGRKSFDLTAVHTVYNELRGKPNCHEYKDQNSWAAHVTARDIALFKKHLEETFDIVFEENEIHV